MESLSGADADDLRVVLVKGVQPISVDPEFGQESLAAHPDADHRPRVIPTDRHCKSSLIMVAASAALDAATVREGT